MPWRTTIGHVGLDGPLEDFGGLAVSPAGCSEGLFPTADFVARGIGRAHDVAVGLTGLELGDEHLMVLGVAVGGLVRGPDDVSRVAIARWKTGLS